MAGKSALAGMLVFLVCFLAPSDPALADSSITTFGSAAGQTCAPRGVAVDATEGDLYVADSENNRIDVFDADGAFQMAFGWGVATNTQPVEVAGSPVPCRGQGGFAKAEKCAVTCFPGSPGPGPGQFDHPTGIGVDNDSTSASFHDLYVLDAGNSRVEKFSPAGQLILVFGGGVNKTTGADVCTVASGNVCGSGTPGPGPGEFSSHVQLAVGPGGVVYVADSREGLGNRLQRFEPTGAFLAEASLAAGGSSPLISLSVDPAGNAYVANDAPDAGIKKYDPGVTLLQTLPGEVSSLATDAEGGLFAAETESGPPGAPRTIVRYDSSGKPVSRFGYGSLDFNSRGVAPYVTERGDVYTSEEWAGGEFGSRVKYLAVPAPGPLIPPNSQCKASPIGNTTATMSDEVNPEGKATTVHVDYIDQAGFENGGFENPETKHSAESASVGEDFHLHAEGVAVTGLDPETRYRCRIVATNADGSATGATGSFETREPLELGDTWASRVGTESAELSAEVNPLGIPATGHFQYVDDAVYREDVEQEGAGHGFDHAVDSAQELIFGSGEAPVVASAEISPLASGRAYHYRVVVGDQFKSLIGSEHALRTYSLGAAGLPDDRGYEQVSPVAKDSGEVGVPYSAGGLDDQIKKIELSSPSGEAVIYGSFTAFGEAASAPGTSQYISRRTAAGWTTANVNPPGQQSNPLLAPYRGISPDLAFSYVDVSEPALTPDAAAGFENLYRRESGNGSLRAMTPATPVVPPGQAGEYCVGYAGATSDGRHVIFVARGALTANAPVKTGFSLYEWSEEGGLSLVSLLPGEIPAQPTAGNYFGAVRGGCGDNGSVVVQHAISADGSRLFWTFEPNSGETRLLARLNGTETIQLDGKHGGPGPAGGGQFWAASVDGSSVFFTDTNRLTANASAGDPIGGERVSIGDLYRFDLGDGSLSDLTVDPSAGQHPAKVQGVLGASDDGTAIYFVATGALTGGETNAAGQVAQQGQPNLYLWTADSGTPRFVATLSSEDEKDWTRHPGDRTARVTPDGKVLAFTSTADLTGFDNTLGDGTEICSLPENKGPHGNRCSEVFVFDAETGELSCASCNLTGSRPLGSSALRGWSDPTHPPRDLSFDGGRVFFESFDSLVREDVDGRGDVYEFERAGAGSCAADSSTFSSSANGCVYLISSGASTDDSYLIDASSDGHDVFFSTRQRLTASDEDERNDIYDARVDGGFPDPPTPTPPCASEACRPPGQAAPPEAAIGSNLTGGPGNVRPHRPPKHKGRKQGKKHPSAHRHGGRSR